MNDGQSVSFVLASFPIWQSGNCTLWNPHLHGIKRIVVGTNEGANFSGVERTRAFSSSPAINYSSQIDQLCR